MHGMTFHIHTYGCQMNVRDSEAVAALLSRRGMVPVDGPDDADLLLVNTCSVRAKAEDKAIGKLGLLASARRHRPGSRIGVMGCMVQRLGRSLFDRVKGLDFAVGPRRSARIPALLDRVLAGEREILDVGMGDEDVDLLTGHPDGTVSAFVNILLGCDRRCAYCIVPDVRGPEWSRPADAVISEISALARSGVREVTLLGQSVMRYGIRNSAWRPDSPPSPLGLHESFPRLLEAVATRTGITRLRFTSSHPSGCTEELASVMEALPVICPHLHLPLQSGSDAVLRRMRRGYSSGDYLKALERVRAAVPSLAVTTDIIVGFPGESETDFEDTRRMMDMAGVDQAFIFKYSPRPGTPAASWPDDVPEEEKRRRNQVLLDDQDRRSLERHSGRVGTVQEVLVEGASLRNPERWSGRTPQNVITVFPRPELLRPGDLALVEIEQAMPQTLYGRVVAVGGKPEMP